LIFRKAFHFNDYYILIDQWFKNDKEQVPFVIEGATGCGKSLLACKWLEYHQKSLTNGVFNNSRIFEKFILIDGKKLYRL
jgi:hypothetical protein